MQNTAIRVKGLQKSFKDLYVLKGVDFEVEQGTIFALLGSNGAGKTTIVRILTTLLRQDSGTAMVNGFDVTSQPEKVRQSISLTGQFAAVDEILTGRENLIMIARLRHLKSPRQVADNLLNRFGLADAADRRVSVYSGGMRRRLDIAMSLIGKPQLIFLDEPTTGLDPEVRLEVWKIIKELAAGGTTIFLTTQYLEEAEQLADRIAILHEGKIIVNGTLAELKELFPPAKVEYVKKQPTLAVIAGLSAKSVDGASAFSYPIIFLPFISSAFVPTATMPGPVRAFAENQPVTSIVDTIRALLNGQTVGNDIWIALAWCLGIAVAAYLLAMLVYKRKTA